MRRWREEVDTEELEGDEGIMRRYRESRRRGDEEKGRRWKGVKKKKK